MSDDAGDGSGILVAITTPFRLLGRAVGYLFALALVLLVPVVVVSACTFAWLLAFSVVELTVGLPLVEPLGVMGILGLPEQVNGVPLLYPSVLGVVTGLLLGWPSTDRETGFSPPILSG